MNAAIVYHKNADRIYRPEWISQCRESLVSQTVSVDIFEIDYGGGGRKLFPAVDYESLELESYAAAQNLLLDRCFEAGYETVFNVNVDDFYSSERFECQLVAIDEGADLVATNFAVVDQHGVLMWEHRFDRVDIAAELAMDHNVICHPSVAYTRRFWEGCSRYDLSEVPCEDLGLWKREVHRFDLRIISPIATFCRHHENRASDTENR